MWKKIFQVLLWILFVTGIAALLGFVETEKQKISCKGIEISIDYQNSGLLITRTDILNRIYARYDSLEGKPIRDYNLDLMEEYLCEQEYVENADIYYTVDGTLKVLVKQRVPILRVYNSSGKSFYIDREGMIMSIHNDSPQRVIVANGEIRFAFTPENVELYNESFRNDSSRRILLTDLYRLAKFIHSKPFFKAMIEQVYVTPSREYELIPLLGKHWVAFGNISEMESKFSKLETFYKSESYRKSGAYYKIINVKYSNQVVCTK